MMLFTSLSTLILFLAFVGLAILLYWPSKQKPYKNAEHIALKEEHDPPITPRHHNNTHHDKRKDA